MDTAIVTGAFTLGGVAIGGIINARVTYWLEKRRHGFDARRTARMFMPRLMRLGLATDEAAEHAWPWADLIDVVESNVAGFWQDVAPDLAGSLSWDEWFAVYSAVRSYEQLTHTAPEPADEIRLGADPGDAAYLEGLTQQAVEAGMVLTVVAISGPGRRQRIRRAVRALWWRIRPPDDEVLLAQAGWTEAASSPPRA